MKKLLCLTLALLVLGGCGAAAKDTLSGTPEELVAQLETTAALEFPVKLELTAEQAGKLGLTAEQFGQYVTAAMEFTPMVTIQAVRNALVQCKDPAAAAEVKKLVAANFDSRWQICTAPEQSLVVASGSYVLLAVGTKETTDALAEALKTLSGGSAGAPDVFFQFVEGEGQSETNAGGDLILF